MPVDLKLHDRPIETVFDLLGHKEDDITYSVGCEDGTARLEESDPRGKRATAATLFLESPPSVS